MRKAFRHTGVLMMLGVVALGLLGAAYTLWWEKLTLEANITTGTFDIDWSCHDVVTGAPVTDCSNAKKSIVSLDGGKTYLNAAQAAAATGQAQAVIERKLPICEAVKGPDQGGTENGGNSQLSLTLHNLYPYAGCEFWLDVHNAGTVPAHVKYMLTAARKQANGEPCSSPTSPLCLPLLELGGDDSPLDVSLVGDQCDGLLLRAIQDGGPTNEWSATLVGPNGAPIQLHGGDELDCHFRITLKQADVEGQGVHLTLMLFFYQWNEDFAIPGDYLP